MITTVSCLIAAATELGYSYSFLDQNKNVVIITTKQHKTYTFVNSTTPFNSEEVVHITHDKFFTYLFLHNHIRMPKTLSYLDPQSDPQFQEYVHVPTISAIANAIFKQLSTPCIVKMNTGSQGDHVFVCSSLLEIRNSIRKIFNKNSSLYDPLVLAQEYVRPAKEYRVVVFRKKIILIYEKNIEDAHFVGNVSPLHWKNAKAKVLQDRKIYTRITKFLKPLYEYIDLGYGGLDIIEDKEGKLWLLEINSKPGFNIFVRDNGQEKLIEMFRHILQKI